MPTAQIAYETATGRILLLHYFAAEPDDPERAQREAITLGGELTEEQVGVISIAAGEIDPTRFYRVDTSQQTLIEAQPGEGGIGFGVGGERAPGAT